MSRADQSDAHNPTLAPSARRDRWSTIERDLRQTVGPLIAGIDEVGRGPLAGPVVACAVIMPPQERVIRGVDDSKVLSADARAELALKIRARALTIGVGAASVREIDRLNIFHAAVLAMRRALGRLTLRPDHVIVDGRAIRSLGTPHTAVIDGDACCYSIACASIIAKVTRDRVMHALAARYPVYRWERNVGYSTAAHFAGISAHGVTPHHRRSFLPVSQLGLPFDLVAADADAIVSDTSELRCLTIESLKPDTAGPSSSPLAPGS
ncbi:MAG TPA: ribonuclease HII [Gemmatimonadaceae bacterium]|nr:ribonuclease HII [Gemmatimonadaceae bacterium]